MSSIVRTLVNIKMDNILRDTSIPKDLYSLVQDYHGLFFKERVKVLQDKLRRKHRVAKLNSDIAYIVAQSYCLYGIEHEPDVFNDEDILMPLRGKNEFFLDRYEQCYGILCSRIFSRDRIPVTSSYYRGFNRYYYRQYDFIQKLSYVGFTH